MTHRDDAPALHALRAELRARRRARTRPRSGTWPSVLNTSPPTVSHSSWGSSASSSSLTSSIGVRPGHAQHAVRQPLDRRAPSTSYSSVISPTISSSRSSIVTRPAVPPYSSTTIAMWNFSVCISRSSSATRFDSGTKCARPQALAHRLGALARRAARRRGPSGTRARRCRRSCPRTRAAATCRRRSRSRSPRRRSRRPRPRPCRAAAPSPRARPCRRTRRSSG